MYNDDQKQRLKAVLNAVSDDKEKRELLEYDLAHTVEGLQQFKKEIGNNDELKQAINETQQTIKKTRESLKSFDDKMTANYSELVRMLGDKIEHLGGVITTSYEKNKPFNAAGVYKDMINQLSAVNESIKNKPVPVWNWPQYAAVSVRDKNFANIDPAWSYQDASTTVTAPFGTLPVFDNAGTIARVTNLVGLPVNVVTGTISISSTGLSGLNVDLSKLSVATSAFAGIRVVSTVTIASTSLSGLKTNLTQLKGVAIDTGAGNNSAGTIRVVQADDRNVSVTIATVTTSLFAGVKTFVENFPVTQPISIGTSTLAGTRVFFSPLASTVISGLKTNVTQLAGIPISLNTGVRDTGTQRVTIATNDTVPISIATSSLSGVRVFLSPLVSTTISGLRVTLASTLISGLKTNITQLKGIAVDTSSGNLSTGTLRVVLATDQPALTNTLLTSIVSTTLAGLKVNQTQIKGIAVSTGNGTSDTGTMRVAIASDNTAFITTSSLAGLKVLDRGIAVNAEQTATTNGLPTPMITDLVGKLINLPYANPENFINKTTKLTATASSTIIAGIASTRLYITSLILANASATNTFVTIQDGSGGTTLAVLPAPANSGAVITLPVPLKTTAGNGLFAKMNASLTTAFITGVGFKGI